MSKISRWPFIYAGIIPTPEQTPESGRTRTPPPWTQPETSLAGRTYARTDFRRSNSDWVMTKVSDDVFQASCGPLNLDEVLRLFREWATSEGRES
ncbi:Imm53 family immunity protein [Streptomyces sp. NPDC002889]|uniref:Imm53 family immunity protein n=1 Tax=Streptomyces sp. NPDC002889 TaxID=3364669 RepID=UPI0036BA5E67